MKFDEFIENIYDSAENSLLTTLCLVGIAVVFTVAFFVLTVTYPMILVPLIVGTMIGRVVYVGVVGYRRR